MEAQHLEQDGCRSVAGLAVANIVLGSGRGHRSRGVSVVVDRSHTRCPDSPQPALYIGSRMRGQSTCTGKLEIECNWFWMLPNYKKYVFVYRPYFSDETAARA